VEGQGLGEQNNKKEKKKVEGGANFSFVYLRETVKGGCLEKRRVVVLVQRILYHYSNLDTKNITQKMVQI